MTIASIYKLNRNDWKNLNIRDAYSIHKAIYSLFPQKNDETRDFVFADKGGSFNERTILILSNDNPITPIFGQIVSKCVPESFLEYNKYGFEIILNPTKRDRQTKKIVAVKGTENLSKWFLSKCNEWGFTVESKNLQINHTGILQFIKNNETYTYNTTTFIGKLMVQDREKFIDSFRHGIGRAKAFGFGLLQIIPLTE